MPFDIKLLVFTDLNDTLLDTNYEFAPAQEALDLLREYEVPLIITTSKTRGQVEIYRSRLALNHPIIAENGAAVYFPPGSFPQGRLPAGCRYENGELVFELARRVEHLLPELQKAVESTGAEIETVFDMPVERIMDLTGMSRQESELAKKRSYIIYFTCQSRREELFAELKRRGLKVTWGSYFNHLGSTSDKGIAAHKLSALYRGLGFIDLITAGFGDNMNDLPMLRNVAKPFLVERPGGGYAPGIDVDGVVRIRGIGPVGWNRGVLELMNTIDWDS